MTPLRQRFLDDLRLRNYSPRTIDCYVSQIASFARHFGRSPELLSPDDVRTFQLHLLDRHVSWSTFNQVACALRFLYGTTLGRPEQLPRIPYGKRPKTLPSVLSCAGPNCSRSCSQIEAVWILVRWMAVCQIAENFGEEERPGPSSVAKRQEVRARKCAEPNSGALFSNQTCMNSGDLATLPNC